MPRVERGADRVDHVGCSHRALVRAIRFARKAAREQARAVRGKRRRLHARLARDRRHAVGMGPCEPRGDRAREHVALPARALGRARFAYEQCALSVVEYVGAALRDEDDARAERLADLARAALDRGRARIFGVGEAGGGGDELVVQARELRAVRREHKDRPLATQHARLVHHDAQPVRIDHGRQAVRGRGAQHVRARGEQGGVAAEARADDERVERAEPLDHPVGRRARHILVARAVSACARLDLLRRMRAAAQHGVDNDLGRVGFDGSARRHVAEDVTQICAHLESRDGRVERRARVLKRAADDAHAAGLALVAATAERRHERM
mmetsp:Transcript_10221/g.32237  ORF Transcript_10221/g.32237 Transcript_10221/m.32237 type:complete len:325 (+) Transcript_10221:131-1105(+)